MGNSAGGRECSFTGPGLASLPAHGAGAHPWLFLWSSVSSPRPNPSRTLSSSAAGWVAHAYSSPLPKRVLVTTSRRGRFGVWRCQEHRRASLGSCG